MRLEILALEEKHYNIAWVRAVRTELFGDWNNLEGEIDVGGTRRFAYIYTNILRAQWIKGLYEKEMQK